MHSPRTSRARALLTMHMLLLWLQSKGEIDTRQWRFLLAGPTSSVLTSPNPASDWLTDKVWVELLNLSTLPHFTGFAAHFAANLAHYRAIFDSNQVGFHEHCCSLVDCIHLKQA